MMRRGKILVADVIINRVLSGKFPGNVKSVCISVFQFQPVSNSRINSIQEVTKLKPSGVLTVRWMEKIIQTVHYIFMNRKASGRKAGWFDSRLTYLLTMEVTNF